MRLGIKAVLFVEKTERSAIFDMAVAPESEDCEATKNGLHLEEYRGKFPEIPEKDLLRIVQKVSLFVARKPEITSQ